MSLPHREGLSWLEKCRPGGTRSGSSVATEAIATKVYQSRSKKRLVFSAVHDSSFTTAPIFCFALACRNRHLLLLLGSDAWVSFQRWVREPRHPWRLRRCQRQKQIWRFDQILRRGIGVQRSWLLHRQSIVSLRMRRGMDKWRLLVAYECLLFSLVHAALHARVTWERVADLFVYWHVKCRNMSQRTIVVSPADNLECRAQSMGDVF